MRNNFIGTSRSSLLSFALILATLLPGLLGLQQSICTSVIQDVTIGGTNAEIVRTFSVKNVPSGPQTIVLTHLPSTIDEQSIEITGSGEGTIVSTVLQNQVLMRENDADYNVVMGNLRALDAALSAFQMEREETLAKARISAVSMYVEDVVSRNPSKTAPSALSLQALTEVLDFQEKQLVDAHEKLVQLQSIQIEVDRWASGVTKMLNALSSTGVYTNELLDLQPVSADAPASVAPRLRALEVLVRKLPKDSTTWPVYAQSKELHINVHSPRTGDDKARTLDFELRYMASPASWAAEYDLRVERVKPPAAASAGTVAGPDYAVRVGLYAVVSQATTEDWQDVRLHLSTSQAQQHIYAPTPPTRMSLTFQQQYGKYEGMSAGAAEAPMQMFAGLGRSSARHSKAMPSMMEMNMAADMGTAEVGISGGAGQMGSPVVFHPEHPVNITSNHARTTGNKGQQYGDMGARPQSAGVPDASVTRSTRIFIKETVLAPTIFTYMVPTGGARTTHLKAWTVPSGVPSSTDMPLLESHNARVFIADTFAGTSSVRATQPGSPVRLDLGQDKNVQLTSTFVLPRKGSRSEDKSTWFVTDKVKYNVENVEHAFTVRSTHEAPHLVVLSDYLPHVGEDGIKVELLQPAAAAILTVKAPSGAADGGDTADVWSEEEFLAAVLAHPALARPAPSSMAPNSAAAGDAQMLAFVSKGSHNIVWARWLLPGQTAKAGLQYKIIWPDGKQVSKQAHFDGNGN